MGGGLNVGADPTDIEDNEFSSLINWYPWAKRLKRRAGTSRVSGEAYGYAEDITGAYAYKTGTGVWTLLVGGQSSLGYLSGASLVQMSNIGSAIASNYYPWSMKQYKNVVYATRFGCTSVLRTEANYVADAGISAPGSAPTLADGGAGNLEAGDYIGVVTFYNSDSGAESDPSDNSSTLTLGASKQIAWSGIPTSTNPQVNARRLYRTMHDQEGEYYFVAQINDNTSTTYTDNAIQSELGVQASFENGLPPGNILYLEIFSERLWATDGTNLYFSAFGLPESFYALDFLQINPDDGHKMSGLLNYGDRLLVGKTNGLHYLTGTDASTFQLQTISDRHGVYSHHSMKAAEGFAFWFGGDNFYQTDGNVVRAIGDIKIRDIVDSIDSSNYHLIQSIINPKENWYATIIPYGGSDPDLMVVYNYKDETWTTFEWKQGDDTYGCPQIIADFFDSAGQHIFYGNLGGGDEDAIFKFFDSTANSDLDKNIECEAITKFFGTDSPESLKFMRQVGVQGTIVADYLTASLLGDNNVVKSGPVDVYMYGGRNWKRFPLANNGNCDTILAVKLEYDGQPELEILGISFDVIDTGRRVPHSETF